MLLLALLACKDGFEEGDPVAVEVRIVDLRFGTVLTGSVCADGGGCADVDAGSGVATLEVPSDQPQVLEIVPDETEDGAYVPNILAIGPAASTRQLTSYHMDRVWHASLGSAVDALNDGTFGNVRFSVTDGVGTPLAGAIPSLSDSVGNGPAYVSDDGVRLADDAGATTDAGWGLWFDVPLRDDLDLAVDYAGDCETAGGQLGAEPGSAKLVLEPGALTQIDVICL